MEGIDFELMKQKWGKQFVFRKDLGEFSEGILNKRTQANRDSERVGIEGRFYINGRCAYPVDAVIEYMKKKKKEVPNG